MNLTQKVTKNIKSFLAYRISFIILSLTTLPLFIYGIILYVTEYSQKKEEIFQTNSILAIQIKKNIEDDLELKDQILNLILDEISLKKDNVNSYLSKISKQFDFQNILYATFKKENLVIQNAANDQIIGKEINALKEIIFSKSAFFGSKELNCPNCIYFSKAILQNQKTTGVIILSVMQKDFLDFSKDQLPEDLEISIIDSQGKVIISTNKNYKYFGQNESAKNLVVKDSIKNTSFSLVLSVEKKSIHLMHFKKYFIKHGILLVIIYLILFVISNIIIRILAKPIKLLLNTMQNVENGDLQKRYEKQKLGFEINYIGSVFNEMMDSLIIQEQKTEKEKIEKLKYLQELTIANQIQSSLLPDKDFSIKNLDLAFGNIFAKEVGGDFYDFFEKNGKVFFVIADIASKGILACLYALTLRSIIRSFASSSFDLEQIIINTNELFIKDAEKNSMFATAFFGLYDVNTKKLEYCNCGHMPAILRKNDFSLQFLTTEGKALGIEDFKEIKINHTTLKKDELLILYTDGIIDAIDINNKFFGEKNLYEFIKKIHDLRSKEIVKNLFESLKIYSKDTSQYDDATIVVFRIV
jgi:serine phosphatase RsbU (regulator of sigma subunit)